MRKHPRAIVAYKDESRLFFVALSLFVVAGFSYMYFVSESVLHVVMRKETDRKIATISTDISRMEAQYIDMQHSVSSDIASHKGFVIADHKVFIDKGEYALVSPKK